MKVKLVFVSLALGIGVGAVVIWMMLIAGIAQAASIAEIHVCPSECPYSSIQAAVDAAQPGAVIKVAQGIYTDVHHIQSLDTATLTATQVVAITKPIIIQGGYSTSNWTTPDPFNQPSILDAGGQGRVMLVWNTNSATIDGLWLTGGDATGLGGHSSIPSDAGGGVHVFQSTVVIANNIIQYNYAHTVAWDTGYGGGMYFNASQVTIENNIIQGNTANTHGHGFGGGISMFDSQNAKLTGNIITDNTGTTTANGSGGGLYILSCINAHLEDNLIYNNLGSGGANYSGGGLFLQGSDHSVLTGNVFWGNTAGGAWSWGGGLYIGWSNSLAVSRNIIDNNTASTWDGWGGGMYVKNSHELMMSDNVIRNNYGTSRSTANSWGGGLYIEGGSLNTLVNNAFIDNNVTTAGSGLYIDDASPRLVHTTFARNLGGDGSGLFITGTMNTVPMTNTIITGQVIGLSVSSKSSAVLNTSLWYDNGMDLGGTGTVNHTNDYTSDPAFLPDGYHLGLTSTAIDLGIDTGVEHDIDGDIRPSRNGCDIGADEYMSRTYLPLLLRTQ